MGNFILYVDGDPVIVDAGVGTYTALTFSKRRYELWNMQSAWHNLPLVNGAMQQAGAQYKATDVSYRDDEHAGRLQISMDLARAYPPQAALRSWMRYFTLDRKAEKITLKENYELTAVPSTASTEINFLSYCSVSQPSRAGEILFYNKQDKIVLQMKYDPALMDFSVENKVLEDPKMISHWGKQLYRLSFKLKKKALKGSHQFVFQKPVPVSNLEALK